MLAASLYCAIPRSHSIALHLEMVCFLTAGVEWLEIHWSLSQWRTPACIQFLLCKAIRCTNAECGILWLLRGSSDPKRPFRCEWWVSSVKAGPPPPPLEAILVIFGRRALIFFYLKALGKKWKMTPLLCACAVVITLETQKCRKRAPRSVEFNFFTNCDRYKRFSQNERRRADLQNVASDFWIFA